MKVLVTGAGGFLGQVIVKKLLARGDSVVGIARSHYPQLIAQGVDMIQGSITDVVAVERAVAGCDAVIHVAAEVGVCGKYSRYYQTNVKGSENILQACLKEGIKKLVYTSSPSVVFEGKNEEGVDESIPYAESYLCHYPSTKAIAERKILEANGADIATVALRPHLIWGPNDPNLVARFIDRARQARLCLIGSQDTLVDTIYVDNAADAHLLAMDKLDIASAPAGKVYFLSNDEPVYTQDLVNSILAADGLSPVKSRLPKAFAYCLGGLLELVYYLLRIKQEPLITRFVALQLSTTHWYNIDAAKQDLGYKPEISIEEGLALVKKSLDEEKSLIT